MQNGNDWYILTAILSAMSVIAGTLARYAYIGMIKTLNKIQETLSEILQRLAKQDEKNENVSIKFKDLNGRLMLVENKLSELKDEFVELRAEHDVCKKR